LEEDIVHTELNKTLLKVRKDATNKPEGRIADTPVEAFFPERKKEGISSAKVLALLEKEMLRLLINYGFEKITEDLHVCDYLLQEITELKFETPIYQKILQSYKKALQEGILPDTDYMLVTEDSEVKREIIGMVTLAHEISPNWEKRHQIFTNKEADDLSKTVYNSILRLKRKVIKKMLDETKLKK